MRRLGQRLRLLLGFVAIGFGVLFGKSGSWAMARYFQLAMPLKLSVPSAARNPSVTVIVPAYNESARVGEVIECLKHQTYPLFRCLVVDDCSTDSTAAAAVAAADGDPRFEVVKLLRNSGLPAARNAGLLFASTEFVLFLDADDFLTPDAIQSRVEHLRKDPAAAGSYGHALHVVEGVNWRKQKTQTLDKAMPRLSLTTVDGESPFVIHQVLMRTSAALEIGGFDEKLDRGCEDTEFWFRSLRSGHEYIDTQARDCLYVQRSGSMVESSVGHHVETYMRLVELNLAGDSPAPMMTCAHLTTGPLPKLTAQAVLQRRAFKFLGMMATSNTSEVLPAAMNEALGAPRVISNETARDEMRLGAGRSMRRAGSANPRLLDELVCVATYTHRDVLLPRSTPEPLPLRDEPSWAILVCDGEHVSELDSVLSALGPGSYPRLLTADSLTHNRGAADALAELEKWPTRSLVSYLLQGCCYQTVLIPHHSCEANAIVERVARARGANVLHWTDRSAGPEIIGVGDIAQFAADQLPTGTPRVVSCAPVLAEVPTVLRVSS